MSKQNQTLALVQYFFLFPTLLQLYIFFIKNGWSSLGSPPTSLPERYLCSRVLKKKTLTLACLTYTFSQEKVLRICQWMSASSVKMLPVGLDAGVLFDWGSGLPGFRQKMIEAGASPVKIKSVSICAKRCIISCPGKSKCNQLHLDRWAAGYVLIYTAVKGHTPFTNCASLSYTEQATNQLLLEEE